MEMVVTLKNITNGIHTVEIKREFGAIETRNFTLDDLLEFLDNTRKYCERKGYECIYNGIKISRVDAYAGFDEIDFKVMDQELHSISNSDQRHGRELSMQFFLEDEKTIALKVYWDGEEVETFRFENKGKLIN